MRVWVIIPLAGFTTLIRAFYYMAYDDTHAGYLKIRFDDGGDDWG